MGFVSQPSIILIGFFIALFGLAGCSSPQTKNEAFSETQDPSKEMMELERSINQAKSNQIDVLSPKNYSKAMQAMQDAKDARGSGGSNQEILDKENQAQTYLSKANKTAEVSRAATGDILLARNDAINAQAERYFEDDFKKADDKLRGITEDIESGSTNISKQDQTDLIQQYKRLEMKGTQQVNMGDSLRIIQSAKNEGAEEWAPRTLQKTEQKVSQLDTLIKRDPKNTAQITPLSDQLRNESELLLRVTRQSKLVENANPEESALQMEQQKAQIGQLQEETASAQDQSLQQQAELSSLQEEQQRTAKIAQIQKRFSPNEANVIQENGKVVIRLKGLHFPSSKATISSKDFNLLNQVADVLREFEGTQIAVEGHTDSRGSKQANFDISEKRAEAVKDYLLAQNAVAKDNVKTEGKGFNQPIATNKTKEGRAQNRRVDIILDTAKG